MSASEDIEAAARTLARSTALSLPAATDHLNRILGARTTATIFDGWKGTSVPDTETDPHMFMTQENITRTDLGDALREYRNLDTWDSSPWAHDEIGVLATDFINWYRWERL